MSQSAASHINPARPVYGPAKTNLIKAALDSVMERGHAGGSIRKICERAGVSVGLINYHFPSIHDLMAAAYMDLAFTMLDPAIDVSSQYAAEPRRQLSVFIAESFGPPVMQREVLRAWIVFWGLIETAPKIREAHDISNAAFRSYLETVFIDLDRHSPVKPSPRMAAIGLTAIMDGLWLEWCLAPDNFSPDEAIALSEHWIDSVWSR